MIDNDSIGDVLERALAAEPPMRGGSDEVFAAAGALRRRRRVLTAVSGLATVAVLAGAFLGVSALAHPGTRSDVTQPAAPPAIVTRPSASTSAAQPTGPTILETLKTLVVQLPANGTLTKVRTVDAQNGGFATYTDNKGKTLVMATFAADANQLYSGAKHGPGTGALEDMFKCPVVLAAQPHGTTCVATTLPDGAKTISVAGPNRGDYIGVEGVQRTVTVLYPNGTLVTIGEWNLADSKRGPVTRSTPAFSLAQLYAIATSPAWTTL